MVISFPGSTGISSFLCRVGDFKINTRLGMTWFQTSSGQWEATDRGASNDVYEADITTQGIKGRIEEPLSKLWAGRLQGVNQIQLSDFESNEKIFGANLNYAGTIDAVMLSEPTTVQKRWKVYETKFKLRAISPGFTGIPTGSISLSYLDTKTKQGLQSWNQTRTDSYDNTFTFTDHWAEKGALSVRAYLSDGQMAHIRNISRVTRSDKVWVTSMAGVENLYGPINPQSFMKYTKLRSIEDEEMVGLDHWYATLNLLEWVVA